MGAGTCDKWNEYSNITGIYDEKVGEGFGLKYILG
jgi:hypothetical protein